MVLPKMDTQVQPWIEKMLAAMPHPALVCEASTTEFHFCLINPAFEQLFNDLVINKADISHYTFVDFLPWRAAEKAFAALNESVRTGRALQCNLSQDTEQKIIIQINPIHWQGDTVNFSLLQFQALSRDNDVAGGGQLSLTELLLEQLAERERLYHSVFSQAAIGIARLDLTGAFIEVNQRLCQHLNFSEIELLSLNLLEVISTKQESLMAVLKALNDKEISSYRFETLITRRNNTQFWALLTTSLVTHANGKPMYLTLMVEDIDASKETEKELKQAKLEREHLLNCRSLASEAGGICNWSINLTTLALDWDQHMFEMYGVPMQENLTYQHWRDTVHPEDVEVTEQAFFHSIANKTPFDCEFRIVNQTTGDIRVIKAAAFVLYEQGEAIEAYGVNVDVTKEHEVRALLQQQAQKAEQANEAKSRFLATMSHEIRTPMNGVVGMIDLLKKTPLNASQADMVNTMRDSSFALLDIINDVLDFSKIEAGKMVLDKVPCALLQLTEKTCDALWVNAQENHVNIRLTATPNLPQKLLLDPVRVRQILLNLMANSIKFSRSSVDKLGLLQVSLDVHTDHSNPPLNTLKIQVEDDGVGMTPEQVDSLFSPFTQADSSTTRKFGGTGLGLTITHSLVEMMGGRIEVRSELGVGSRFTVMIPVDLEHQATIFNQDALGLAQPVLVAIKDNVLRQNCHGVLTALGLKVKLMGDDTTTIPDEITHKALVISDHDLPKTAQHYHIHLLPKARNMGEDSTAIVAPDQYQMRVNFIKPSELLRAIQSLTNPDINELQDHHSNPQSHLDAPFCVPAEFTLLVAEDHPTNRKVLASQLEQLGVAFKMCEDGAQAWQCWQQGHYPLILTDCHMPNMDGYELTRRIRSAEQQRAAEMANSVTPPCVIIAITANAIAEQAEQAIALGFNDYLTKPLEMLALKETLFTWLECLYDNLSSASDDEVLNQTQQVQDQHVHIYPEEANPQSEPLTQEVEPSPIDYPYLISVIGMDDKQLINEILLLFWQNLSQDVNQIHQLILAETEHNAARLKQLAHGAKGACHSSGALVLAKLFKQVEGAHEDQAEVTRCLARIDKELARLKAQLQADGVFGQ